MCFTARAVLIKYLDLHEEVRARERDPEALVLHLVELLQPHRARLRTRGCVRHEVVASEGGC